MSNLSRSNAHAQDDLSPAQLSPSRVTDLDGKRRDLTQIDGNPASDLRNAYGIHHGRGEGYRGRHEGRPGEAPGLHHQLADESSWTERREHRSPVLSHSSRPETLVMISCPPGNANPAGNVFFHLRHKLEMSVKVIKEWIDGAGPDAVGAVLYDNGGYLCYDSQATTIINRHGEIHRSWWKSRPSGRYYNAFLNRPTIVKHKLTEEQFELVFNVGHCQETSSYAIDSARAILTALV